MVSAIRNCIIYFSENRRELFRFTNILKATGTTLVAYFLATKLIQTIAERDKNHLSNVVRHSLEAKDYETLSDIFTRATTYISFWGGRYITVGKYKGSTLLKPLCQETYTLFEQHFNINKLTIKIREREIAQGIDRAVDKLYKDGNQMLKTRNLFIGFLCWYRESNFGADLEPPECWYFESISSYYTKEQYKEAFNQDPIDEPSIIDGGDRWFK